MPSDYQVEYPDRSGEVSTWVCLLGSRFLTAEKHTSKKQGRKVDVFFVEVEGVAIL